MATEALPRLKGRSTRVGVNIEESEDCFTVQATPGSDENVQAGQLFTRLELDTFGPTSGATVASTTGAGSGQEEGHRRHSKTRNHSAGFFDTWGTNRLLYYNLARNTTPDPEPIIAVTSVEKFNDSDLAETAATGDTGPKLYFAGLVIGSFAAWTDYNGDTEGSGANGFTLVNIGLDGGVGLLPSGFSPARINLIRASDAGFADEAAGGTVVELDKAHVSTNNVAGSQFGPMVEAGVEAGTFPFTIGQSINTKDSLELPSLSVLQEWPDDASASYWQAWRGFHPMQLDQGFTGQAEVKSTLTGPAIALHKTQTLTEPSGYVTGPGAGPFAAIPGRFERITGTDLDYLGIVDLLTNTTHQVSRRMLSSFQMSWNGNHQVYNDLAGTDKTNRIEEGVATVTGGGELFAAPHALSVDLHELMNRDGCFQVALTWSYLTCGGYRIVYYIQAGTTTVMSYASGGPTDNTSGSFELNGNRRDFTGGMLSIGWYLPPA